MIILTTPWLSANEAAPVIQIRHQSSFGLRRSLAIDNNWVYSAQISTNTDYLIGIKTPLNVHLHQLYSIIIKVEVAYIHCHSIHMLPNFIYNSLQYK